MKIAKIDKNESSNIICCECKENEAVWFFEVRQPFSEVKTHYMPYCEKCGELFDKNIWKK